MDGARSALETAGRVSALLSKIGRDFCPALVAAFVFGYFFDYLPVPVKVTLCGLSGALSVKMTLPLRAPFCVGVKLTSIRQLAPGPRLVPLTHGVIFLVFFTGTSAKSPVVAILPIVRVEEPELVAVTFFLPFVLPTRILPHFSEVGFRLMTGPPPCPPQPGNTNEAM